MRRASCIRCECRASAKRRIAEATSTIFCLDDGTLPIEIAQSGGVVRELISEDNSQDGHGGFNPAPPTERDGMARQRPEQNFTFGQSRVHFLG